jgi:NAD(P)-dependent dehydrogenase (short-subunit alcohol dehydrogenase family)
MLHAPPTTPLLQAQSFQGKVAVVTGGGTGLGLEVSRALGRLGATIVVLSRDPAHHATILEDGKREGFAVRSAALDVREPDRVAEAFLAVAREHGKVDILINNAAGNFVCPAEKLRPKGWRAVVDIALTGAFYCAQAAGRHMLKRGEGAIVNVLATYAWTGMPGVVHSAAAKAGLWAVTRTLAAEWGSRGVRVVAIAPGAFESLGAQKNLWPSAEAQESVRRGIPAGRFATAFEVAQAVAYLASPWAAYVNGSCLTMDGGRELPVGLGESLDASLRLRETST